jgi:prevent-host-death family protein
MATTVKVAEAKTHLSELLGKVERGESFVIARGDKPVARLVPLEDVEERRRLIEEIIADRPKPGVSQEEIVAWIREARDSR